MKIINLTPHSITIGDVTIPGTKTPARCDTVTEPFDLPGCPVPVVRQSFGDVHGLPDPAPGTIYIVSMPVAQAVGRSRDDVFIPGEQIRDETGRIIGCRSIARLAEARKKRRVMYQSFSTIVRIVFEKNLDSVETFSQRYGISLDQAQRLVDEDLFSPEEAISISEKVGCKDIFVSMFV